MSETRSKFPLRLALIPAVVIAFLAIYPQITLWVARGSAWQGSYYVSNYDETAYSAYVNALVAGKPRANDPFIDGPETYESLYSIQFIPAYFVALAARLLGGSTSAAFIFLSLFCAAFSSLAIFWLLRALTGDDTLSAVGVLVVLCLGTAAAYQGELRFWISGNVLVDFLPFLRRYQPGFAFGLFFVFCGFVWRTFTVENKRSSIFAASLSGLIFSTLVFSYFYLWTAAAAWLFVVSVTHFLLVRSSRDRIAFGIPVIGIFAIGALIPYFYLISQRSTDTDSVQLLTLTHVPDLASPSLLIGLLLAAGFVYLIRLAKEAGNVARAAMGLAFALTPLILFNQQIVTGRSLQPVHYEIFISNYIILIAGVIFVSLLINRSGIEGQKPKFRKALVYVGILAAGWGFIEATGATGRSSAAAYLRDESVEAIRFADTDRLSRPNTGVATTMLATNFVTSDFIPTVSTLRPLWNPHTSSAGGVSVVENKRLFYTYLYFSGFSEQDLSEALRVKSFEVTAAIFGSERALPALGGSSKPISSQDIDAEVEAFKIYYANLAAAQAFDPQISYILVPAKAEPSYANLDKWYRRDEGKLFGLFKLYRLTKRLDK